ncbi:MAG: hypothetical protein R3C42_02525 [Parvularculaceae bacterium]|nr:hypothetical protein [Parvularculaceae bacterium]
MKRAFCAALAGSVLFGGASAQAATAIYDSSMPYTSGPLTELSTAGDGLGQLVPLGEWFSLLFSQPFGVSRSDSVSIFTLAPPRGAARVRISFGAYNSGSPIFVVTRSVRAGRTLTVNNLFQQGCSALGGCDFIFISTIRQRRGANGATVDYVSVNGETTAVTAPTPELSVWSMMILAFGGLAWRMKARKRYSLSSA